MIEIDLKPHTNLVCPRVTFWQNYLKDPLPSAWQKPIALPSDSFNATARNRMRHAYKSGYRCKLISWDERNNYLDDIYVINHSADFRQGKRMGQGYNEVPHPTKDGIECEYHYSRFFGVFDSHGQLIGYINANFCGNMVAASQILGHAEHLKNGIMLALWHTFMLFVWTTEQIDNIIYSRWKDGQDGLKYWKHSIGMTPQILIEKKYSQ